MPPPRDVINRNESMDKQVLDYVLACYEAGRGWWSQTIPGTNRSMRDHFVECRQRYNARRSVACLESDVKSKPFPRSSNIGIGAEMSFGEFLVPNMLANTRDLDPALQVTDIQTEKDADAQTIFLDRYLRQLATRKLLEYSTREVFTVGGCYHKWHYDTLWTQREIMTPLWVSPVTGQPVLELGIADPKMPDEKRPRDPLSGQPLTIKELSSADWSLKREGPSFDVVPVEDLLFPPGTTAVDTQVWDYLVHAGRSMKVSPWWFLGREGDPWEGKLKNLDKLWTHLGMRPEDLYRKPGEAMKQRVQLAEYQGPFAVTYSGKPVEILALIAPEIPLLLGWRITPFPRRNVFNRQVWNRGEYPLGIGIPESVRGERDYLDSSVNQDADQGNISNHPPVLMSDLAMLDDEEYELTAPGTRWIMRDINGAKLLPMTAPGRDPIVRENWIFTMMQRKWGTSDLMMNLPNSSMASAPDTARGTRDILNAGSVRFGHLTKRLAETDTEEYAFAFALFGTMLTHPITVLVEGKSLQVDGTQRGQFFDPQRYRVTAIGNGITTNPILRQQMLGQNYAEMLATQNPFVVGDLALLQDMTQDLFEARGLHYTLKTPPDLQMTQAVLALLKTPEGQQILLPAIQQAATFAQQQEQMMAPNGRAPNGGSRVAVA